MNKRHLIEQIQSHLLDELSSLQIADEPNASDPSAVRAAQIRHELLIFKFLPAREYGPEDVICPSVLAELEINGIRSYFFMVPQSGGLITTLEGKPVQVITPQSPMGEALLGKKVGDTVEVSIRDNIRRYKVISVC